MSGAPRNPDEVREYLRSLEHVTQLSSEQIERLPDIVPLHIAAKAYGINRKTARCMDKEQRFPVAVRSQGRHGAGEKRVVLKADIVADLKRPTSAA